tara:strand:- start:6216 stop:6911 length:696 start_codon:yes stop_codon:yes gene_type:complete
MPRTFGRSLLRGTFLVLAVAALPAAVLTFRDLALTVSDEELIAAAGGVAGYIVFALFSRNLAQWHFHVHELSHMLAALCCLARIDEFHVSREEGGYVSYSGVKSNAFIMLAPYWLPTLCLIPIALRYIVQDDFVVWFVAATAFAWALHADLTFRQTRTYQSDISDQGIFFSFVSIVALNGLCWLAVAAFALGEPVDAALRFAGHAADLGLRGADGARILIDKALARAGALT